MVAVEEPMPDQRSYNIDPGVAKARSVLANAVKSGDPESVTSARADLARLQEERLRRIARKVLEGSSAEITVADRNALLASDGEVTK